MPSTFTNEASNPSTDGKRESFNISPRSCDSNRYALTGGNMSDTLEQAERPEPEVVNAPAKRAKRTEAQMVASMNGDLLAEASYLKNRVGKLEEKIAQLFAGVSKEASELVLSSAASSHLRRYLL